MRLVFSHRPGEVFHGPVVQLAVVDGVEEAVDARAGGLVGVVVEAEHLLLVFDPRLRFDARRARAEGTLVAEGAAAVLVRVRVAGSAHGTLHGDDFAPHGGGQFLVQVRGGLLDHAPEVVLKALVEIEGVLGAAAERGLDGRDALFIEPQGRAVAAVDHGHDVEALGGGVGDGLVELAPVEAVVRRLDLLPLDGHHVALVPGAAFGGERVAPNAPDAGIGRLVGEGGGGERRGQDQTVQLMRIITSGPAVPGNHSTMPFSAQPFRTRELTIS